VGLMENVVGFMGLSGMGASQKAQISAEIDLFQAVSAHVSWKQRLQEYLNGTSIEKLDAMVVCRDDECTLGKWIHGPGLKHFYMDETFHQLRHDHAKFHKLASNVVLHAQANERVEAETLLVGEYRQISRKVVQTLTELNQHISA
jgi:Chemoreceptor zinc-binding domain